MQGGICIQADLSLTSCHPAPIANPGQDACLIDADPTMERIFDGANLMRAKLQGADLRNVKLDEAEQLRNVASLYEAMLPDEIESEFKTRHSRLFRKPERADDDPNYIFE